MAQHWLLRVGDGAHFKSSSPKYIWGVNSKHNCTQGFLRDLKKRDILWFVLGKDSGRVIGCAEYVETKERILGPLISLTETNEELGWTKSTGDWDTEIHYTKFYNITSCNTFTRIKSPLVIRKYNSEKCEVNLPEEYNNIVKYSGITRKM